MEKMKTAKGRYWRAHLRCVGLLLVIWFLTSFGCGILLRDWLDGNFSNVGSAPFGFWMAQQGSIISFVIILLVYKFWMERIESVLEQEKEETK